MGEILMINPLNRENRRSTFMTVQAKTERLIYYAFSLLFFLLASFLFFDFVYEICNVLGAIVSGTPAAAGAQLVRSLPKLLLTATLVYINLYLRCAYKARSEKGRAKAFQVNGWVCVGLGAAIALYVLVGVFAGLYGSLVEGYPSLLFPLDIFLAGLCIVAQGVFSYRYGTKLKSQPSALPIVADGRNKHLRRVDNVFYSIGYLIVLYAFSTLCYVPFAMDFTRGNLFFNLMMILLLLLAVLAFFFYIFVFEELTDGVKARVQKTYSLSIFALNVLAMILYLVSVQIAPEAPNLNAYGLLPIEHTAKFNVFWIIFLLNNLGAPLAAFVKTLFIKKEKPEERAAEPSQSNE